MSKLEAFKEPCSTCGGTGIRQLPPTYPPRRGEYTHVECLTCNGLGKLFKQINVSINGETK